VGLSFDPCRGGGRQKFAQPLEIKQSDWTPALQIFSNLPGVGVIQKCLQNPIKNLRWAKTEKIDETIFVKIVELVIFHPVVPRDHY